MFAFAPPPTPPADLGATNYAVDVEMPIPRTTPGFDDEFSGPRINRAAWRFDTSMNATGWPNHEREYYSAARPANARIAHGALVITARHETLDKARFPDWGGQAYSSAKLISTRAFGYGFYAIRAKLPCGHGIWPAIWLLPDGGTWPDKGEIDIMEMVGWNPGVIHATLHSRLFNHVIGTQRGAERTVTDACGAFHTYQLDWRPDSITIGVDGHGYMQVRNDVPGGHGAWPFDRPYRLILNVAVGGDWGGAKGIDDRAFPQAMAVDYVRFWPRGDREK